MKKKLSLTVLTSLLFLGIVASGCSNKENVSKEEEEIVKTSDEKEEKETKTTELIKNEDGSIYYPQLSDDVAPNEALVEMVTSHGSIKIKLFPALAPKAVENFLTLSKDGYYDGITFHRVIEDFMIQGGDPTGTGRGGESIWGERFEDEITPQAVHIRGALSMANAGADTNGSQFFIVQNKDDVSYSANPDLADELVTLYSNGGAPGLDGGFTIFGQVVEGMDTVDTIAASEVDGADKPISPVVIKEIKILKETEK